jgi:hypothetical protein
MIGSKCRLNLILNQSEMLKTLELSTKAQKKLPSGAKHISSKGKQHTKKHPIMPGSLWGRPLSLGLLAYLSPSPPFFF